MQVFISRVRGLFWCFTGQSVAIGCNARIAVINPLNEMGCGVEEGEWASSFPNSLLWKVS